MSCLVPTNSAIGQEHIELTRPALEQEDKKRRKEKDVEIAQMLGPGGLVHFTKENRDGDVFSNF